MNEMVRAIATLYGQFSISAAEVNAVADRFAEEMENGLAGKSSRLKMLPSFVDKPTGQEAGEYLVLDFGGTNLRLLAIRLQGNRTFQVLRQVTWPLHNRELGIDLTSATMNGAELFGSIATAIGEFVPTGEWRLAHTFSFPCRQFGINHAELIRWTKEIRTSGVEGENINRLLTTALVQQGLTRIQPVAVLNDTVGTYLAAAYAGEGVAAGAICGTGHNIAYLEPEAPDGRMVINLESGNFDPGMGTAYDITLDQASEKPGEQLMEKQVAGRYLGELFRLVLISLRHGGLLSFACEKLNQPYSLSTASMNPLLADESSTLIQVEEFCRERLGLEMTLAERRVVKTAATLIVSRSARLTAAAFLGVLRRLDPGMCGRHTIAVDGSLYDKMPGYREIIERVLVSHLPQAAARTCLVKDGSGIGAAVAAALSAGND